MIGGFIIILVAMWMYQSAIKAEKSNTLLWVAAGSIAFFIVQMLLVKMNIIVMDMIRESDGAIDATNRSLVSIGDRAGRDDDSGSLFGIIFSIYLELFPPFMGIVAAGLVRIFFILDEKPTKDTLVPYMKTNLFGGFVPMLVSIKDSFKAASQERQTGADETIKDSEKDNNEDK